jgi:hypothetical protein
MIAPPDQMSFTWSDRVTPIVSPLSKKVKGATEDKYNVSPLSAMNVM